jgi:NDP-sugar pyrophosphorylase family protein
MEYDILEGPWTDAGTLESWQLANRLMLDANNEVRE